uniref:Hydrogenase n=1 Tax=candidate division WOR-3 bacterium TaxID=2052148 RepID=A0A7V3ZSR0_UNCW3
MEFKKGKLPPDFLKELLNLLPPLKKEIKIGPKIGGDSAIIEFKDLYLIVSQDPITFTEKEIGYYGVIVNANDVAVMGAKPLYFLFTLLLPEGFYKENIKRIFKEVKGVCKKLGIQVIGGHTEITPGLKKIILSGTMIGIRKKEKGLFPKKVNAGDFLFCIKEVPIEGISIIAKEKKEIVKDIIGEKKLNKFLKYNIKPGISIVKEAILISGFRGTLAMHDPTEGGIINGIWELCEFLNKGIIVYGDKIPVVKGFEKVFEYFNMDPLKTISSGSLLVAIKKGYEKNFELFCKKKRIGSTLIGIFKNLNEGRYILKKDRKVEILPCQDDISKIF